MMYLCLDVGNSQVHCGVFSESNELLAQFRHNTGHIGSSDQFGIFLLQVLRENHINPEFIGKIIIASVVPSIDHSIASAMVKYLKIEPIFVQPGIKTGIKTKTNNPSEIGADLIAGAVGGVSKYPHKHLLIYDFGTATTLVYVTPTAEFIGGAFLPGVKLMMNSLQSGTAKLPAVRISSPDNPIGSDTKSAIQSGLYYCQVGAVKELVSQVIKQFNIQHDEMVIIGTGGFANLFEQADVFDVIIPELVLIGLKRIIDLNES